MEVRLARLPEKNVEESGGHDNSISRKHLSSSLRRGSSFLPTFASSSADGDIADLIRMPGVRTLQRHAGLFKKLIFGQILSKSISLYLFRFASGVSRVKK